MVIQRISNRALALAAGLAIWLPGLGGCPLPLHTPPPRGAPAATVKFRLGHHYTPAGTLLSVGTLNNRTLRSELAIDERELVYQPVRGVAATWTRVKPGWRAYRVRSWYKVSYWANVRESYYENYYTTCSKYSCTYSGGKSNCRTRTTSCTKRRLKYRTVRRLRYRNVARCHAHLTIHMRKAATYLVSYRYVGPRACSLTCHIQQFKPGGGFRLSPCPHVR